MATSTPTTNVIKEFLKKETYNYIREKGILPALPSYDPNDDVAFTSSFSSDEEIKTIMDIVNLRGYSYRVRNTEPEKRGSYECKQCKNSLSYSLSRKHNCFKFTKKKSCICDCPREGRCGNKLHRFPTPMVMVAISALFESRIADIADANPNTIIKTLKEEYDFRAADKILVERIREEFDKIDPFKSPEFNDLVTSLSGCSGNPNVWYEVGNDKRFKRYFMGLQRCEGQRVCVMKHHSKEQEMVHYVAFIEGGNIPLAWGAVSVAGKKMTKKSIGDTEKSYETWFGECLGQENLVFVDPNYGVNTWNILSWGYNAFGTACALYIMCTRCFVTLGELLGAHPSHQSNDAIYSQNVIIQNQLQSNHIDGNQNVHLLADIQQQQEFSIMNSNQFEIPPPPPQF